MVEERLELRFLSKLQNDLRMTKKLDPKLIALPVGLPGVGHEWTEHVKEARLG